MSLAKLWRSVFLGTALSALAWSPMALAAANDGDWEGDLRCEAAGPAPAIYEPVLASVSGRSLKLLRGAESEGEVVPGSVADDGSTRISGRTLLADGSHAFINFTGRFHAGRFNGNGTAIAEGGGVVRPCTLTLQATIIARGEGDPTRPYDGSVDPAPAIVYGSGVYQRPYRSPTWYDNDYWWRREMLRRWEYRLWVREQEIRRYCASNPPACGHKPVYHTPPPRPIPPSQQPPAMVTPPPPKPVTPPPAPVATPGTPRQLSSPSTPVTVVRPDPTPVKPSATGASGAPPVGPVAPKPTQPPPEATAPAAAPPRPQPPSATGAAPSQPPPASAAPRSPPPPATVVAPSPPPPAAAPPRQQPPPATVVAPAQPPPAAAPPRPQPPSTAPAARQPPPQQPPPQPAPRQQQQQQSEPRAKCPQPNVRC